MSDSDISSPPDFAMMRVEYMLRSLDEADVGADPIQQLIAWLNEAVEVEAFEPNAMTLATATREGVPSCRVVLLKGIDTRGLVFFTNYLSQKGKELEANPRAAVNFFWPELQRQVRVEGAIVRTSAQESDDYFNSRPSNAKIGSAASIQSQPIASRAALEQRQAELESQYPDGNIPRPRHWGGYRLIPSRFEFWQGRLSRLHDRIEYRKDEQGNWVRGRLSP